MVADDVSNGEWCGDLRRRPYGCTSTLIASLFCESNRQKAEGMGLLIANDKMLNKTWLRALPSQLLPEICTKALIWLNAISKSFYYKN